MKVLNKFFSSIIAILMYVLIISNIAYADVALPAEFETSSSMGRFLICLFIIICVFVMGGFLYYIRKKGPKDAIKEEVDENGK